MSRTSMSRSFCMSTRYCILLRHYYPSTALIIVFVSDPARHADLQHQLKIVSYANDHRVSYLIHLLCLHHHPHLQSWTSPTSTSRFSHTSTGPLILSNHFSLIIILVPDAVRRAEPQCHRLILLLVHNM